MDQCVQRIFPFSTLNKHRYYTGKETLFHVSRRWMVEITQE